MTVRRIGLIGCDHRGGASGGSAVAVERGLTGPALEWMIAFLAGAYRLRIVRHLSFYTECVGLTTER